MKYWFWLGLLFTFFKLEAQQNFLKFPISEDYFSEFKSSIIVSEDHKSLVFKNYSKIVLFPFDETPKIEKKIHISLSGIDNRKYLHASIYKNNNYLFYLSNKNRTRFELLTYYTKEDSLKVVDLPLVMKDQIFLDTFSLGDIFYLLSLSKINNTISLFEIANSTIIDKYNFSFENINLKEELFETDLFAKKSIFKLIPEFALSNLNTTHYSSKMYYNSDSLTFTFEKEWGTKIWSIRFNDKKLRGYESRIQKPLIDFYTKSNSFVSNGFLYQCQADLDSIVLEIKNLHNGKLVGSFYSGSKEPISFSSSEIRQDGGASIFSPTTRILKKTKQLLRKISYSTIAISVDRNTSDQEIVTIGSYQEKQSIPYHGPSVSGSRTIDSPYGSVTPTTMTHSNAYAFGYNNYHLTKSAYFNMVIDSSSKVIIEEDNLYLSSWKKIRDYENSIAFPKITRAFVPPEVPLVYKLDDKYLYGHFSSKERVYEIKYFLLED